MITVLMTDVTHPYDSYEYGYIMITNDILTNDIYYIYNMYMYIYIHELYMILWINDESSAG